MSFVYINVISDIKFQFKLVRIVGTAPAQSSVLPKTLKNIEMRQKYYELALIPIVL